MIGQVNRLELDTSRRFDALEHLALMLREAGTQHFVTGDELVQRRLHGCDIDRSTETHAPANVVGNALRLELPQEPHALLRRRQRQRLLTRHTRDVGSRIASGVLGSFHLSRKAASVGATKSARRETRFRRDCVTRATDLSGGDGVSAQGEEARIGIDRDGAEYLSPYRSDCLLRCREFGGWLGAARRRIDELAVLEDRVCIQRSFSPSLAAFRSLYLAARSFGQSTRIEKNEHRERLVIQAADQRGELTGQTLRRDEFLQTARNLDRDADAVAACGVDRESRDAPFSHGLDLRLDGALDVLRVHVLPAQDDEVFQATRDVQLLLVEESQVAGSQPPLRAAVDETCPAWRFRVASNPGLRSVHAPRSRRSRQPEVCRFHLGR